MTGGNKRLIRNSTVEFLTFTSPAGKRSVEARYEDDTARGSKNRG